MAPTFAMHISSIEKYLKKNGFGYKKQTIQNGSTIFFFSEWTQKIIFATNDEEMKKKKQNTNENGMEQKLQQ